MDEENRFELRRVDVRLCLQERAADLMAGVLSRMDREYCCVVNLDSRNRPINYNIVSVGDIDRSRVPVQNVFKSAILSNAASLMLFHNHPSGVITPSRADFVLTVRLLEAGEVMNIPVADHVIVGGGNGDSYSFHAHHPEIFADQGHSLKKILEKSRENGWRRIPARRHREMEL